MDSKIKFFLRRFVVNSNRIKKLYFANCILILILSTLSQHKTWDWSKHLRFYFGISLKFLNLIFLKWKRSTFVLLCISKNIHDCCRTESQLSLVSWIQLVSCFKNKIPSFHSFECQWITNINCVAIQSEKCLFYLNLKCYGVKIKTN